MKIRNLSADEKTLAAINRGDDLINLKIFSEKTTDEKCYYNIILNSDTLLRIEEKQNEKNIRNLRKWAQSAKNLVSVNARTGIRRIIDLDTQIKDKIRTSLTRSSSSADGFTDFFTGLERRWKDIEKIQKRLGVTLLRRDQIGYCSKCRTLREASGMVSGIATAPVFCKFCSKPITETKNYYCLPEASSQYVNGFWFEDYVARKLEQLGWKIFIGVYVYGRSGIKHEIDIVGIKDGRTAIFECKSGNVGLSDLSMFVAKFSEIRSTSAIFICTQKINKDLHKLGKVVGGLQVIDDIKSDNKLITKLRKV